MTRGALLLQLLLLLPLPRRMVTGRLPVVARLLLLLALLQLKLIIVVLLLLLVLVGRRLALLVLVLHLRLTDSPATPALQVRLLVLRGLRGLLTLPLLLLL